MERSPFICLRTIPGIILDTGDWVWRNIYFFWLTTSHSDQTEDMDCLITGVYFAVCCLFNVSSSRDKVKCAFSLPETRPLARCSGILPGRAWLWSRREGPALSPVNKAQKQSEREDHPVFFRLRHPLSSTPFCSRHLAEFVERGFVHVLWGNSSCISTNWQH